MLRGVSKRSEPAFSDTAVLTMEVHLNPTVGTALGRDPVGGARRQT